jgi:hypothetical protein
MQKVTDIDVIAGTSIEREINETEIKQFEEDLKNLTQKEKEIKAKAAAKTALLAKLGISAEEAALLLG